MKRIICAAVALALASCIAFPACAADETKKVDDILAKMPARARSEISIGDKAEFVKKLNAVLEFEKAEAEESGDLPLLYLLDKKNGKLSEKYEPKNLVPVDNPTLYKVNKSGMTIRRDVKTHLEDMVRAWDADTGRALFLVSSAYRSYKYQSWLFNHYVETDGLSEAERYSARPGTSQHQLGTAMDFGSITNDFADTRQGKWMYENAWKFGWSLSFPKGYESETGFMWESWHFRYIGIQACELQREYFNDIQQYMLEFIDLWKKS